MGKKVKSMFPYIRPNMIGVLAYRYHEFLYSNVFGTISDYPSYLISEIKNPSDGDCIYLAPQTAEKQINALLQFI